MSERGPRYEAMQAGLTTYLTGVPCKSGHIAERMTASGACVDCRREGDRRRYALDPQKICERKKAQYVAKPEEMRRKRRENYAKNAVKERAIARVRSAQWRAANPDKVKAQAPLKRAYAEANPEKSAANLAKRRAAKLQRTPKWLSVDDFWLIEQAYEVAALRSKATNIAWHVDHIFPLQGELVSGLHVPTNLQVIPWFDNLSKANKFEVTP